MRQRVACVCILRPASGTALLRDTPRSRARPRELRVIYANHTRRVRGAPRQNYLGLPSRPILAFHRNSATAGFEISLDHRWRKRPTPLESLPAAFHRMRTASLAPLAIARADSLSSARFQTIGSPHAEQQVNYLSLWARPS